MARRLASTWTLSILGATCVPLVVVALATHDLLERTTLDAAARIRAETVHAAAAVLHAHLDDGRHKLAAIALLLGDTDARAAELDNFTSSVAARELDRLLEPHDAFLEVGVRRLDQANDVLSQSQSKSFGANQIELYTNRALPPSQSLDASINQVVEQLPSEDPRLLAARAGRAYTATTPEIAGEVLSLSLSQPIGAERLLLARLDLEPLRALLRRLASDERRGIELLDASNVVFLSTGAPAHGEDALITELDAGHGGWRVRVSEPRGPALAPLATARSGLFVALLVALLLGVVLSILFARRIVAPVRHLARTAERFGAGELALRTGIERADEIGQLAAAFDRMADSLAELDRLKSEFVAHASHELRTPLTSAKLALANVEDGLAGPEALARVRADLDRLVRLVNELLDLARIEAGIELASAPTRLEDVAREVALALQPLATVPIEVRGASEELALDRARIHQVLVNLVDNARKHARTRVTIEIGARELAVVDDGPGVPEAERERVFERFVRLAPPGASGAAGGAGLGLSIARKLVELHGGTVHCTGSAFVVRF